MCDNLSTMQLYDPGLHKLYHLGHIVKVEIIQLILASIWPNTKIGREQKGKYP